MTFWIVPPNPEQFDVNGCIDKHRIVYWRQTKFPYNFAFAGIRDRLQSPQYSLEGCNQPIGISEYELEKLYPTKVEGMIPTIEEIESKLSDRLSAENDKEKQ